MRPFTKVDNKGNYNNSDNSTLINVNTWKNFNNDNYVTKTKEWGWRSDNERYNKSVMSDGLINFTPQYKGGGNKNIHTRQCMFSIENLAWKDFDPFAFENTLSWEQRGPNGGRIMWFPPYGLSFNETTQAKWQSHQFIGRGEDVYTYQGTVRSGTLSFILVVDHPSIIDYVFGSHNNKNKEINDNDIHRYFAGCDNELLQSVAQPTLLTDEFRGELYYGAALLHEDLRQKDKAKSKSTNPTSSPNKVTFYWYFPNNYSGVYDNVELNSSNGVVSAMKYTLIGTAGGIKRNMKTSKKEWTPIDDSVLTTTNNIGETDLSTGYCMGKKTPDNLGDEYLLPQQTPRFLSKNKNKNQTMTNVKGKGRFYRVDYDPNFKWPTGEDCYKNTLDQECANKRKIENNFDYNINVPIKSDNENEQNYSFLVMCCALMEISEKQTVLLQYLKDKYSDILGGDNENSEFNNLVSILKNVKDGNLKIKTIISKGYSSVQQNNTEAGKKRNELLAKQRAETMKKFFNSSGITTQDIEITTESNASVGTNDSNESGENETKNRRAELIIEFETSQTENAATINTTPNEKELSESQKQQKSIDEYNEQHKYIGYKRTNEKVKINDKEYYLYEENSNKGRKWYNEEDWIGRDGNEVQTTAEDGVKNNDKEKNEKKVDSEQYPKKVTETEKDAQENKKQLISIRTDVSNVELECEGGNNTQTTINIKTFKVEKPLVLSIKQLDTAYGEIFKLSTTSINASGDSGATFNITFTPPEYNPNNKDENEYNAIVKINLDENELNQEVKEVSFNVKGKRIISETDKILEIDEKMGEEAVFQPPLTKWRLYNEDIIKVGKHAGITLKERSNEKNKTRYDQEYYFFKKLEKSDPITYETLTKKLQYFDPTFHSMTPEGFNGRLTFLQQCMRQGDTLTEIEHLGDKGNTTSHIVTAQNLAFGRPPFCVLRVGDFYYQTIIIENLSINYDFDGGVKWDLNSEGIGVQPLLAQVQLSIKLLGGGDLSGPIRRLQNAMSFNYYANTSLYDNRADRYEYEINEKTGQKEELKTENSFIYDAFTKMESVREQYIKTNINEKIKQQLIDDKNFGQEVVPDVYEKKLFTTYELIDGKFIPKTSTFDFKTKDGGLIYDNNNKDGHKGVYQRDNDTHRPIKKENNNNTPKEDNNK